MVNKSDGSNRGSHRFILGIEVSNDITSEDLNELLCKVIYENDELAREFLELNVADIHMLTTIPLYDNRPDEDKDATW